MAVDSKAFQMPLLDTGTFPSTASPADVTETLGYQPSHVVVYCPDGTNIDIISAFVGDTVNSFLLTGSTGVTTEEAVATGVDITATGFICRLERQTANEVNHWVAYR